MPILSQRRGLTLSTITIANTRSCCRYRALSEYITDKWKGSLGDNQWPNPYDQEVNGNN